MEKESGIHVKTAIFVLLLLLGAFFVVTTDTVSAAQAGDYTYTVSGGVATISAYTGVGGAITIPSTLGGYDTRVIGDNAFNNVNGHLVTSVTIPDSVTSIGSNAFQSCPSLTSVTIPGSVTTIGSFAFYFCTSLTSVTIPSSVTTIGGAAFRSCTSLTTITVAPSNQNYASVDGVLYLKDIATLIQCPSGRAGALTIPNSVTDIGMFAFSFCTSLTSLTIGNSVIYIWYGAFWNCANLTSISFLGLVAPFVDLQWINRTDPGIRGHAYAASNFPAPGNAFYGLTMGAAITIAPVAPGAPTDLTATPGNAQVVLAWHAPAVDGGSAITGFKLYRSTASGGTYSLIASPSGLTYTDTGLTNGQTYWYKVSAVNAIGEGANCTAVSVLVPQPVTPANDYAMLILVLVIAIGVVLILLFVLRKRKAKK